MSKQFASKYKVAIGDINYGGHLGNDKALVIFHDARLHFLKSIGLTEVEIGENLGIIMVETGVRYLREVFHSDDLLTEVSVSEIKGKKFTLKYRITRQSDGELVIRGFTSFLIFDYTSRKVSNMPEQFREKLSEYLESNK